MTASSTVLPLFLLTTIFHPVILVRILKWSGPVPRQHRAQGWADRMPGQWRAYAHSHTMGSYMSFAHRRNQSKLIWQRENMQTAHMQSRGGFEPPALKVQSNSVTHRVAHLRQVCTAIVEDYLNKSSFNLFSFALEMFLDNILYRYTIYTD